MGTDFPNYYTGAVLAARRLPLRQFYDWVWFQRQIHYAGIDHQLGGYIPFTPWTMLPFVPLTTFAPQQAKQIWLLLQVVLFLACMLLLARISKLTALEVLVLALLAQTPLGNNLRWGQYYIFLLALLVVSFWCLLRGRDFLGGAILGLIFALKLYTLAFLFYFAVRRQWRALLGFIGIVALLGSASILWFGWRDIWYFITTVMVRGMDGSVIDPYNPGFATMTALLRRTLVAEPELNPHPIWYAPAVFFFFRSAYTLGVLVLALIAVPKIGRYQDSRTLAWFIIMTFTISPIGASYHFILLVLPVALLIYDARRMWAVAFISLYTVLELPLFRWDAWLFPKAWLLLSLFLWAGWGFLRRLRSRTIGATLLAVAAISAASASLRMRVYRTETPQNNFLAIVQPEEIYSAAPDSGINGWMYEAIVGDRYVLRRSTAAGLETFSFDGDAFHPSQSRVGRAVVFELVRDRHSQICLFDVDKRKIQLAIGDGLNPTEPALSPDGASIAFIVDGSLYLFENGRYHVLATGELSNPGFFPAGERVVFAKGRPGKRSIESTTVSGEEKHVIVTFGDCFSPAVSPDGHRLAFTCSATGAQHIWVQDLASGKLQQLTHGSCNNGSPAWDQDSQSLVFTSDCNRGLGLTALYRLPIPEAAR
jgi:hypothetical protein